MKLGAITRTPTSTTELITLHDRCRGEKRVPAAFAQTLELPCPVPLLESVWPGCSLIEHAFGAPSSAHPLLLGSPCLCLRQHLLGSPWLSWAASAHGRTDRHQTDRQTDKTAQTADSTDRHQTDRQTDRHRQTEKDRDRQTDRQAGRRGRRQTETDRTVQNSNLIRSSDLQKLTILSI